MRPLSPIPRQAIGGLRPILDLTGHMDGFAVRLDGEVLISGSQTWCARAQVVAYAALDRLDAIFRVENLQGQRREV